MIDHIVCTPGDHNLSLLQSLLTVIYGPSLRNAKRNDIPRQYLLCYFIVIRDGGPVASIALFDNPHLSYTGSPVLIAGNFECINDPEVSKYLFDRVENKATELSRSFIIGPMNGSTWDDYRLPLSGDGGLFFSETPYPLYYHTLWEEYGFSVLHRYFSAAAPIGEVKHTPPIPGIKIRNIELANYEQELERIYPLCMKAFASNHFFSPIDKPAFVSKYLQVKSLIDPDLVLIAEDDVTKQVLAFVLCLPDHFDSVTRSFIIKTLAKDPDCNIQGLATTILDNLHHRASVKGYQKMIHAFMHEDNRSIKLSRYLGGKVIREYALYIKEVKNGTE